MWAIFTDNRDRSFYNNMHIKSLMFIDNIWCIIGVILLTALTLLLLQEGGGGKFRNTFYAYVLFSNKIMSHLMSNCQESYSSLIIQWIYCVIIQFPSSFDLIMKSWDGSKYDLPAFLMLNIIFSNSVDLDLEKTWYPSLNGTQIKRYEDSW